MSPRLGLLQINVTDRAMALDFFSKKLGLPCRKGDDATSPFEVDLGNVTVLVYGVEKLTPSTYATQRITPVIQTDDLVRTIDKWTRAGVEFVPIEWASETSGIASCPYGRFIAFRDPFGNVFELLQPEPE